MPQGLPRKVRIAFLLQVVTVSLAVLACGWLISVVIKHGYVQNASQAEADDFFAMRAGDPVFPVPQSYYIDGWFVPAGVGTEGVPERLAALATRQEWFAARRRCCHPDDAQLQRACQWLRSQRSQ